MSPDIRFEATVLWWHTQTYGITIASTLKMPLSCTDRSHYFTLNQLAVRSHRSWSWLTKRQPARSCPVSVLLLLRTNWSVTSEAIVMGYGKWAYPPQSLMLLVQHLQVGIKYFCHYFCLVKYQCVVIVLYMIPLLLIDITYFKGKHLEILGEYIEVILALHQWIESPIRASDNDSTSFWSPGLLHTLGADGHI